MGPGETLVEGERRAVWIARERVRGGGSRILRRQRVGATRDLSRAVARGVGVGIELGTQLAAGNIVHSRSIRVHVLRKP